MTTKKVERKITCFVCGQKVVKSKINYNCTGKKVCDDCQKDYYKH